MHSRLRIDGLVSIVMPAYNAEDCIARAVSSVLAQSYPQWELLIVDDASRDRTLSIVRELSACDSRICVIHLDRNGGVANARNAGIAAARGQYLAFLDSDDEWMPDKLHIQTEFMRRNAAAFTFTGYHRFNSKSALGREMHIPDKVTYLDLLKGNVIGCLTVMIDAGLVPEVRMPCVRHEDFATWLQILKQGHVALGIQKDLARYRVSSRSVSGDKMRSALWTWKLYRDTEQLSIPASVWCFFNYGLRAMATRLNVSEAEDAARR